MKRYLIIISILVLRTSTLWGQVFSEPRPKWLLDATGRYTTVLIRASKSWRLNPAVGYEFSKNRYVGIEVPLLWQRTRSTQSSAMQVGFDSLGRRITLDSDAQSIGLNAFYRQYVPIYRRFHFFYQLGFGHYWFREQTVLTDQRRFSFKNQGWAPAVKAGLAYSVKSRFLVSADLTYTTSAQIHRARQPAGPRPPAASIRVGVTFLLGAKP